MQMKGLVNIWSREENQCLVRKKNSTGKMKKKVIGVLTIPFFLTNI